MPLATRIIPVLLADGSKLVKGVGFDSQRVVGHVQQAARIHQARGVDELVILDVAATRAGRGPDFAFIERLTEGCFMPITVGGGVRSIDDIRGLLNAGADKVAICTAALHDPDFLRAASYRFGAQALMVSVDVAGDCVTSHSGTKRHPEVGSVVAYARQLEALGAGEILLNSVDRDGTMVGCDLDLIRAVAHAVDIPVVACGGAGSYAHMLGAVRAGASAVAAGAMFQFLDCTPRGAARFLSDNGVTARL